MDVTSSRYSLGLARMQSHYEESLQRDVERIRGKVTEMVTLAEVALRSCSRALRDRNRQVAYSVILRDQRIDELEKEIDRLCLEFIVRQQPVAGTLRFAYAAIKINADLERVGDYAESMARQIVALSSIEVEVPQDKFAEIANLAIPMLHDAVQAFVRQDADLARRSMEAEDAVDQLRHTLNAYLVQTREEGRIPREALGPLMTIVNRFERVADQAKSICQEVLYMLTGEYYKHRGSDVYRVLFVDEHNSCRSPMAEGIGNALKQPGFVFASAGLEPRESVDGATAFFMNGKGIDISRHKPHALDQVPNLDHYQIIVALAEAARKVFPPPPNKGVCMDWSVKDPSTVHGTADEMNAAYEQTYQFLRAHIQDLVKAILGDEIT